MFRRVLIANRGEITVRIAQTLQEMGITAVAVFSEPDRRALHVACADEAYSLDGRTSVETYLRGDKVIDVAKRHHIDAIHPGYGFLSENADFAQMCIDAGITFIGPSPDAIRASGDKIRAKRTLAGAGVPIVPGWSAAADAGLGAFQHQAEAIGYPVMVKAAAGGGGKGMRVVTESEQLPSALEAAQREATAAFGDGRVFLEKFIVRPRHVEFQVFGDHHGHHVHLFERECSIQRRHQKIIEEAPSPVLTAELRAMMGEAAVRAAKAIGYVNAGTVEFMLDESGTFYFLEINARLQVEHPVTEATVGHDLVRAQVLVAAGKELPFTQDQLRQRGHAIEARIYAEDPARGFLPSTGTIEHFIQPTGANIRVDSGVMAGSEVAVYYDPLLAKLIVHGRDRVEAVRRAAWALKRFAILGITTNVEFLQGVVAHDDFLAARFHTQWLDEEPVKVGDYGSVTDEVLVAAALATRQPSREAGIIAFQGAAHDASDGPWHQSGSWRLF